MLEGGLFKFYEDDDLEYGMELLVWVEVGKVIVKIVCFFLCGKKLEVGRSCS